MVTTVLNQAKAQSIAARDVVFAPTTVPTGLVARSVHWREMYVGNVALCQGKWFVVSDPTGYGDIMDAVAVLVASYRQSGFAA